jgi:ribosomal protein L37AE/L43A
MNKPGKVADIAICKAQRLIREHICPLCKNTMIDGIGNNGLEFWACPHCAFVIHEYHLCGKNLDSLTELIRTKIREKKERLIKGE